MYKFFYMDPVTTPTAKNNFGDFYQQAITEIHDWFGCSFDAESYPDTCDPTLSPPASCRNCTGVELASLQWGEVGVTNNPKSDWDSTYFPKQTTVAQWGDPNWVPFGMTPEFVEYPPITAS